MKRSGPWLAIAIMFSLPALVFAQATGGSPGKALENGATKNTGGKKVIHAESHSKKGAKTSAKTAAPKLESPTKGIEDGTGKKGQHPTTSARKKPPSPTTRPPDQK